MGIVVKNISTTDAVVKSNGARAKDQLGYVGKGEDHEKVERVWYGNTMGDGRIGDAEIVACVESNRRATNPTRHLIISWSNNEPQPDQKEFDGAVRNVLNELGLSDCLFKAAIHRDTDNVHLHLVVCTVDPANAKMRHTPMIEDRCMKVIARHNLEFGRANHPGDRYVMVAGKPVLKNAARPDAPPVVERAERATAHGKESALDVAKGRISEHQVGEATSWPEFHQRLAAGGLLYEQIGKNMAKVTLSAYQGGDEYLKASQLNRGWTLAALEKRFGPYQAASKALEPMRERATVKETLQQVAEPKPWDVYKAEKAKFLAAGKALERIRKKSQAAEREALSAKQKQARADLQGERDQWRGNGPAFNAAKSLLAQQQAIEKIELKERQRQEWKAAKAPFIDWNAWRKERGGVKVAPPEVIAPEITGKGGDGRVMVPKGDLRDFKGRFVASGKVEYRNKFTEQVEFVDAGAKLSFGDEFGAPAIRASLQLAAQKWAVGPLNITGSKAFKWANALEAVRLGIDSRIEGIDAAVMDAARQQIAAEREAMKSTVFKAAQRIQEATRAERLIVTAEKNRHSIRLLSDAEGCQTDRLPALGMAEARQQGEAVRLLPIVEGRVHLELELDAAGLAQFKKDGGRAAFVQAGAKPGQFVAVVGLVGNRYDPGVMQHVQAFKADLLKRYGLQGDILVAHGKAPFEHQPEGSSSYYVRTRNTDGVEYEHWGVDLERAIEEAAAKPGDLITLRRAGQHEAKVKLPVKGPDGKLTGKYLEKIVRRNAWEVTTLEKALGANEQDAIKPGDIVETGDSQPCGHTQAEFEKHAGAQAHEPKKAASAKPAGLSR